MSGIQAARLAAAVGMALVSMTVYGCGDKPDQQAETAPECATPSTRLPPEPGVVANGYAPELGVDMSKLTRTETGLYVMDLEVGTGTEAGIDDQVAVHYTGWLPNGQQFDSSFDRGEPLGFALNETSVIAGWVYGVQGMKEGGRRRLVIPPGLAYGDRGAGGVIPPGATLVFDVELIEVQKATPAADCAAADRTM